MTLINLGPDRPTVVRAEVGQPLALSIGAYLSPTNRTISGHVPGTTLHGGMLTGAPTEPGVFFLTVDIKAKRPVRRTIEILVYNPVAGAPPVSSPVVPPPDAPTAPPPIATVDPAIFFQLDQPCLTPGCDQLRLLYRAELTKVGGCSGCARSALQQKYLNAYRKLVTP